ncbi:MAG: RluA family pseudouridine synthase [Bacilli bacterium]|nr:RluA family pseudouridine synthase [Bacilli bacterium]
MDDLLTIVVEANMEGMRIDKFVSNVYSSFSRTRIQSMISNGDILINDKEVKPSFKVSANDVITIEIVPINDFKVIPENIPLKIVYEDNDLIIIDKPQGMVVHPANGHYSGTLVNALLYHFENNLSSINGNIRPGIVHRIDKDTSGLLMVAKNDYAHEKLAEQLKNKTASRVYYAIVSGEMEHNEGVIKAPIGRHLNNRKKMAVVSSGKNAVTHFKVIERFNGYTLIECKLETGRTHQIRVHMSYIHHPIVGDQLYGGRNFDYLNGQLLHAKSLVLNHPTTNERMIFECELPDYFTNVLNILRNKGTL